LSQSLTGEYELVTCPNGDQVSVLKVPQVVNKPS